MRQAAKLGVAIGAAVAVFAGLGVLHPFGPRVPRMPDEAAAAMSVDPSAARILPVMKQTFPSDYDTLMRSALANVEGGASPTAAGQTSFAATRAMIKAHQPDIARAPDAELLAFARAELALLNSLDDTLCTKLFNAELTPADQIPDAARSLMGEVGVANLRAARAGIDHPTSRPATLQPADAVTMLGRMRAQPLDARQLAIYTGGTLTSASPHDQCALARGTFASITQLPPPQGGRIVSFLISQAR